MHRDFQEWVKLGIFERLWKVCLQEYDRRRGIPWRWQSADGVLTKAPLGGGKNWAYSDRGHNPTDHSTLGVSRSVLTDARGVPIGIAIAGANVHDTQLLAATLASIPVTRPWPTKQHKQHLFLDKAYFGKPCHLLARRWVVEGAYSWTNRARRLLVRWEKNDESYLAFIHLRSAYVALKRSGVLG